LYDAGAPPDFRSQEDRHGRVDVGAGRRPLSPAVALLLVSALWGATFVAIKEGLADASPLLFVGLRFLVAAGILAPRLARTKAPALRAGVPLGAVLALAYATQTLGLTTITPARSAFLTGLNVPLVPLWAALLLRRRPPARSLAGLLVSLPGLWLLTRPAASAGAPGAGEAWTLACAALFALHVVLVDRWGRDADTTSVVAVQLATTALLALAGSALLEEPHLEATPRLARSLFVTAVLATAGAIWLQMRFQPRVDPTRAALIYATEPAFAAAFAALAGERLAAATLAGGALILAGTILSERGAARRPVSPPR